MTELSRQVKVNSKEQSANLRTLCVAVMPKSTHHSFPLYWVRGDRQLINDQLLAALSDVLVDPLLQTLWTCPPDGRSSWITLWHDQGFRFWMERQLLPGVTDNLGRTIEEALSLKGVPAGISVASGTGFLFPEPIKTDDMKDRRQQARESSKPVRRMADGSQRQQQPQTFKRFVRAETVFVSAEQVEEYARYRLFHPLTDRVRVHDLTKEKEPKGQRMFLSFPAVELPQPNEVSTIDLNRSDAELEKLSADRLLALTLEEMQAIRNHFALEKVRSKRVARGLSTSPTDVELEVIAQTWSEHCKHKIFNAEIEHSVFSSGARPQTTTVKSLYKTYIKAATAKLAAERDDLLSVFEDNSGVVKWSDDEAICFKVETHNSPSALEPYGGALTGILGVNRDILGTGLGARPIFNTDVFCFCYPSKRDLERPKLLPAPAIPIGVRRGVEDGGNKSGIPTVNGAVFFHTGYRAKPLVFCGTGGMLPISIGDKKGYSKYTRSGDTIVMAGGRVGIDGVHGATFSSEALHEGSPVSAVQIGDPFTQKRLIDFVLAARDLGLITGITDNGAGGLSSSVGEMARLTGGASIDLKDIPLKYPGLSDWEIVISESQERMTLSTADFDQLAKLADNYSVEVTAIGRFSNDGYFEILRAGKVIAWLDLEFLHEGVPTLKLKATTRTIAVEGTPRPAPKNLNNELLQLLSNPNISSRESIIRQYDHEVQGTSVIKPLMGRTQKAACDAAVLKPSCDSEMGVVVSNGLCPQLSRFDAYLMAVCAVDEAVRNAVCVGANPSTLSLLDNFCWPDPIESARNVDGAEKLGQLVRACQGLYDACLAFGAPLISGKDSMKNDFDDGTVRLSIPPTLLISAVGKVNDVRRCLSMEFKNPGDLIFLLSAGQASLTGSHYAEAEESPTAGLPSIDLKEAAKLYKKLHEAIEQGWISSAHDLSEGGLAVALAECTIGGGLGATVNLEPLLSGGDRLDTVLFGEGPARIIISARPEYMNQIGLHFANLYIPLGQVAERSRLTAFTGRSKVDDTGRRSGASSKRTKSDRLLISTFASVAQPGKVSRRSDCVLDVTLDALLAAWESPLPTN